MVIHHNTIADGGSLRRYKARKWIAISVVYRRVRVTQIDTRYVYGEAVSSAARSRDAVPCRTENCKELSRFWELQDRLTRLVEVVCDNPDGTFDIPREEYRDLFQDVIDVISSATKTGVTQNIAISTCCNRITQLLTKLEMLTLSDSNTAAM